MQEKIPLTRQDFVPNTAIKWCAWCWDFIILSQLQNTFVKMWIPKEKITLVSWIGCAGRFPYYMNTYGFHTIHGRAVAVATWVKLSNPDLSVFVIGWDWDILSIWWNHLLHAARKNIWIKIIMPNNEIYALTKWQLSPTTEKWVATKTTPSWSYINPINPVKFTLWADCAFVARSIDTEIAFTQAILDRAANFDSTVFVEILQKCITFAPNNFSTLRNPILKEDYILRVEHGKPLVFWKEKNKWIAIENYKPKIVEFESGKIPENVVIYDETNEQLAYIIANLEYGEFPMPIWIFKAINKPTFESSYLKSTQKFNSKKNLEEILNNWEVF